MGEYLHGAALSSQTVWFFGSIGVGAAAMLLYTLMRIFTRKMKKSFVAVAVWDILFFVLLTAMEFSFILMLPQNALRWFHILGQILGGVFFWATLSPFLFHLSMFFDKNLRLFGEKVFCFTPKKNSMKYPKKTEKKN